MGSSTLYKVVIRTWYAKGVNELLANEERRVVADDAKEAIDSLVEESAG